MSRETFCDSAERMHAELVRWHTHYRSERPLDTRDTRDAYLAVTQEAT